MTNEQLDALKRLAERTTHTVLTREYIAAVSPDVVLELIEEVVKWKDEYENVAKFATDYERQLEELRNSVPTGSIAVHPNDLKKLEEENESLRTENKKLIEEMRPIPLNPHQGSSFSEYAEKFTEELAKENEALRAEKIGLQAQVVHWREQSIGLAEEIKVLTEGIPASAASETYLFNEVQSLRAKVKEQDEMLDVQGKAFQNSVTIQLEVEKRLAEAKEALASLSKK